MGTTIALMGRKGGITKTTLAVNLAAGCVRAGLRTVLIDADGQGNASTNVRVAPHDAFYDLLVGDAEFADVLTVVPVAFHGAAEGEMYLLSASDAMRVVEKDADTPTRIYQRLAELEGWAEVVIVDTSPGTTEVHAGIYFASDYILLPSLCEFHSINSLGKTLNYLAEAEAAGRGAGYAVAQVLGIVPNRFSPNEKVQQVNLGVIQGKYSEKYGSGFTVFPAMRDLTVWNQAVQVRQSIYAYQEEADDYNARRQARVAVGELAPVLERVLDCLPHPPAPSP